MIDSLSNFPSPSYIGGFLSGSGIWVFTGIIVFVTIIYSIIFLYHWKKYSIDSTPLPYFTVLIFIVGTLFLITLIVGSAISQSL